MIAGTGSMICWWGDVGSNAKTSDSSVVGDVVGFSINPGADKVYNRKSGKWETPAKPNFAPNMAYLGWGIYVTNRVSGDEKKRVLVIFVLFVFSAIFWAAFEQAPTSLNLFARDFTRRNIGGFEVPATWFQSINSAFIIIFAPIFGSIWLWMAKRKLELSSPAKFALGLAFAGVGFALMIPPSNALVASGGALKVSAWWLTLSYFFQTFGELCLSPVGLSSMTKLSPRKYVGQMMGIWFLATSVGNLIAGLVGGNVDPEKLEQTPMLFTWTTIALMASAIVLALLTIPIRRMMHNAESLS